MANNLNQEIYQKKKRKKIYQLKLLTAEISLYLIGFQVKREQTTREVW